MKAIQVETLVKIPEGVTVQHKARSITVKGPRGTLQREFKHIDLQLHSISAQKMKVVLWHAGRKHAACLRTIASGILNMIKGVTKGFEYKMRFVYAHFPINVNITENGTHIEIRNFLGEKIVRKVKMLPGVTVATSDVKDEIVLTGNDVLNVSQSAASIQQSTAVKKKDIRKFLDGVYLSERGLVIKDQ